jgi:hypothetical protein
VLSAELVRARRRGDLLELLELGGKARERAAGLAALALDTAREHVGSTRAELYSAWRTEVVAPRDRKLFEGLLKLIDDACDFAAESSVDPVELRRGLFRAASRARSNASAERFERDAVVREVARASGLAPEELELQLYSDLKGEHRLLRVPAFTAESLLSRYDAAQLQGVLLRAVRVEAIVSCRTPGAYRALFNRLKFRRLLYTLTRLDDGRYRLVIDGPYSLFDSVTKYGLNLALALPALLECDELSLGAELRWGKRRDRLKWEFHAGRSEERGPRGAAPEAPKLGAELDELCQACRRLRPDWLVAPAEELLDLPGVGLCVPDLVVVDRKKNRRAFLELLGFWSRDAVWRRVELVERGLSEPVLFLVSERLRVSESVLPEAAPAALCVYKGKPSPRKVVRQLERLLEGSASPCQTAVTGSSGGSAAHSAGRGRASGPAARRTGA